MPEGAAAARQSWHRFGCLISTVLGLPAYAERRFALAQLLTVARRSSAEPVAGFRLIVETAGDVTHLDMPRWTNCSVNAESGSGNRT